MGAVRGLPRCLARAHGRKQAGRLARAAAGASRRPEASGPAGAGGSAGASPVQAERRVFRLPGPLIVWWLWVVFAAANLIDIAINGRDWGSIVAVAIFALVTGLTYAMAWRPRVVADGEGITVQNPLRDHRVPWGGVNAVTVGESVQVRCSRGPGDEREKVVHSWALAAPRRVKDNRNRADLRGQRRSRFTAHAQPSYGKLPQDAQELLEKSPVFQIAEDLDRQARLARERGAPPGARVGYWPWPALAAMLIPAVALLIVVLAR